ncbi:hypothetical protein RJ640_027986, partial [Escallonia rubra]
MDKQIMDLSNSTKNEFVDLIDPQEGLKNDDIVPSYDFQPIRPASAGTPRQPSGFDSAHAGGPRVWTSADSKNYGSLDSTEPGRVILEKDRSAYDAALVSEIDKTVKKHADNLLHVLEGVSARLSQLESRSRQIENSVDDLKLSIGSNHGSTDGKMRQLEIILREVQTGVQAVMDKQEVEAELQLCKLQVSKVEHQSETQNTLYMEPVQPVASAPQLSHHQLPPVALIQPHSTLPPPPPQQILPPSVQLPNQFSHHQIPPVPQRDSYYPPPGQTPEAPNQQYQQLPPQQMQPPPPGPPQQQYQLPPAPQFAPPPPQQHSSISAVNPPQPPSGHHREETPYIPSHNYPPSMRQPPSVPTSGAPPSQQFYGSQPHAYEPPSSRATSGISTAYGSSSGTGEPFPYSGSPPQYGSGSPMKSQQLASGMGQSGGSGYPQLPTARILPHAIPTASGVGGGSGSAGTGNRVPIDDVVDRVTNMGFPRDQVRAMVRKLTENGQSVDLNVVLDKLMNDGEGNPQRGWFG